LYYFSIVITDVGFLSIIAADIPSDWNSALDNKNWRS